MFGSSKEPLEAIIILSGLLHKRKKWFLWTMVAPQVTENHGNEWGFTWYLPWGIYVSIPNWTQSKKSLAAEGPNLKISYHGTSLKLSQRPSQSAQE